MPENLEMIERGALELPEDQRLTLAHRILQSTEPPEDSVVAEWWEGEIVERIAKLDAGETERISASEVFRQLDERLEK
ncbi:MAG: addiction module protein [Verrucomicrobiota bacterium]